MKKQNQYLWMTIPLLGSILLLTYFGLKPVTISLHDTYFLIEWPVVFALTFIILLNISSFLFLLLGKKKKLLIAIALILTSILLIVLLANNAGFLNANFRSEGADTGWIVYPPSSTQVYQTEIKSRLSNHLHWPLSGILLYFCLGIFFAARHIKNK